MSPRIRLAEGQRRLENAYRRRRAIVAQQMADASAAMARTITELAMTIGELSLASGASASRTTTMLRQVTRAYGLPMYIDITYTRIILSYQPSVEGDPITVMRLVGTGGTEYDRLTRLETLVVRIHEERLTLDEAREQLREIVEQPRVYRPWVLLLAAAVMGGGVAMLLGGNWADIAVAFLATGLVELVRRELVARGLASFFAQAVCAAIPTAIGLGVMATGPLLDGVPAVAPSLVIAAGMVSLLAGLGIVGAAGDAIDGYYISAVARAAEVTVVTGGIVLGLVLTLWLGLRLGVPAYLAPAEGFAQVTAVELVSAAVIALSFGVSCNMGPRSLVAASGLGLLLWATFELAGGLLASHPAKAGVAALLVGFVSRLATRPLRIPMVAMITAGIAPLMPGLMLYRAVFGFAVDTAPGIEPGKVLTTTVLTALSLAAGSGFGANLAGVLLRLRKLRHRRSLAESGGRPPGPTAADVAQETASQPVTGS